MRQDHINEMNDPRSRVEYMIADDLDRWAPKSTRCFDHSPEVRAAWKDLNTAIKAAHRGTADTYTIDGEISRHLNDVLPSIRDHQVGGKSVTISAATLNFGPDWSGDEITTLVSSDILPDAELIRVITAAARDPRTLQRIGESAQTASEKTRSIEDLLDHSPELHPHADDIVHLAAQTVPNHKDVLRSYQRTSVPEVLAAYDKSRDPAPRVDYSGYEPATASRPAYIYLELRIDRERNPANSARLEAAEDVLLGGSLQVSGSFNNVATGHLQELTGTSAHITEEGWAVRTEIDIPPTPDTMTGRTAPDAGPARPPRTAEQESLLPELLETIEAILPPHERQHSQTLALMVATEIPSTADAVYATDRVTLAEVIDHHEQRMQGYTMAPPPAPMRTAELSFPHHPRTALHHRPTSASPAAADTSRPPRTAPDLER